MTAGTAVTAPRPRPGLRAARSRGCHTAPAVRGTFGALSQRHSLTLRGTARSGMAWLIVVGRAHQWSDGLPEGVCKAGVRGSIPLVSTSSTRAEHLLQIDRRTRCDRFCHPGQSPVGGREDQHWTLARAHPPARRLLPGAGLRRARPAARQGDPPHRVGGDRDRGQGAPQPLPCPGRPAAGTEDQGELPRDDGRVAPSVRRRGGSRRTTRVADGEAPPPIGSPRCGPSSGSTATCTHSATAPRRSC